MKILHINIFFSEYGGCERYLLDLCDAQKKSGHDVVVISSNQENGKRPAGRGEYRVDPSFGLRTGKSISPRVEEIVRREDPDVIHMHGTLVFMSPYIVKRLIRLKPLVQTFHDAFFFVLLGQRYCLQGISAAIPLA